MNTRTISLWAVSLLTALFGIYFYLCPPLVSERGLVVHYSEGDMTFADGEVYHSWSRPEIRYIRTLGFSEARYRWFAYSSDSQLVGCPGWPRSYFFGYSTLRFPTVGVDLLDAKTEDSWKVSFKDGLPAFSNGRLSVRVER